MRTLYTLLSLLLILAQIQTNGQRSYRRIKGSWQATIHMGKDSLRVVFNIENNNGHLSATADSPDQGQAGIPCSKVFTKEDSLFIEMENLRLNYAGKLTDSLHIRGIFSQNGASFPLELTKTEHPAKPIQVEHPQTPRPPYPYISKDVVYQSTLPDGQQLQYGATITMPDSTGKYPAILLITGSGRQDRNEALVGHQPFAVIADYLTKHGYLVMRVDDRGTGQSSGNFATATTADFSKDVAGSLQYLKKIPQVNTKKIGLLGHSEGGLIAPMVADDHKDVDFIIMMAGPGIKISQLMELQHEAIAKSSVREDSLYYYSDTIYKSVIDAVTRFRDTADIRKSIETSFLHLQQTMSPELAVKLGLPDREHVQQTAGLYLKTFVQHPWMNYFIRMDPVPYLEKLSCKVLAINGSRDVQVIADPNLSGIKTALSKSKSPAYKVIKLDGLNHLFQECKSCTVEEYGQLNQTISPKALDTIGAWLEQNVGH